MPNLILMLDHSLPSLCPLGEAIKAARSVRGWSQNELASRAGVKQPTLQRIEAGKRIDPGFSIFLRVAGALGISVDQLATAMKTELKVSELPVERMTHSGEGSATVAVSAPLLDRIVRLETRVSELTAERVATEH